MEASLLQDLTRWPTSGVLGTHCGNPSDPFAFVLVTDSDYNPVIITIVFFHVLHDIPPSERQSIVQALAATLKPDGTLYVNEPTRVSHAMAVEEIRRGMDKAGVVGAAGGAERSAYTGTSAPDSRLIEG